MLPVPFPPFAPTTDPFRAGSCSKNARACASRPWRSPTTSPLFARQARGSGVTFHGACSCPPWSKRSKPRHDARRAGASRCPHRHRPGRLLIARRCRPARRRSAGTARSRRGGRRPIGRRSHLTRPRAGTNEMGRGRYFARTLAERRTKHGSAENERRPGTFCTGGIHELPSFPPARPRAVNGYGGIISLRPARRRAAGRATRRHPFRTETPISGDLSIVLPDGDMAPILPTIARTSGSVRMKFLRSPATMPFNQSLPGFRSRETLNRRLHITIISDDAPLRAYPEVTTSPSAAGSRPEVPCGTPPDPPRRRQNDTRRRNAIAGRPAPGRFAPEKGTHPRSTRRLHACCRSSLRPPKAEDSGLSDGEDAPASTCRAPRLRAG